MRVNVYAEELTDRVEVISKTVNGQEFTGLRIYLYLPVTMVGGMPQSRRHVSGPFVHEEGDDDSSAVTFWGKKDLRQVLLKMIEQLDAHYASRP